MSVDRKDEMKQTLKILIPIHVLPTVPLIHTRIIESMLPHLKKKYNVELIWFIYLQNKIKSKPDGYNILDIHDYSDAVELLRDVKPDLVYAHSNPSFDPQFAVILAAKFLNVPVLSGVWADRWLQPKKIKKIFSYLTQFLENRDRANFFIFKTLFVNATLNAIGFSKSESFSKLCGIFKKYCSRNYGYDPKYASDIHWLENESLFDNMSKFNYARESLIVTGNPLYDLPIKRIQNFKSQNRTDKKIQVLFATSLIAEHGIWTKKQRDYVIKNVVKNVSLSDDLCLTIKLNPQENYDYYKSLVHSIDKNILIFKDGDFLDYLEKTDIVISFSGVTSIAIFTLLARKPLLVTNFFNIKGDKPIEEKVAINCESPSQLTNLIKMGVTNTHEEKIARFIKDTFYKEDGEAAQRLCEHIINFIETRRNETK